MKKRLLWIGLITAILLLLVAAGIIGYLLFNPDCRCAQGCPAPQEPPASSAAPDESMSHSTGCFLLAKDNTPMIIIDNCPIVMHDQTEGGNLFAGLQTGDEIKILHNAIMESYPGQTSVLEVTKVADGLIQDIPQVVLDSLTEMGWWEAPATQPCVEYLPENAYQTAVAYANWSESGILYTKCLNVHKMYLDGPHTLPIFRFDSPAQIQDFQEAYGAYYAMDSSYDEIPGLSDVTRDMDEEFFQKHLVLLVYVEASSGSYRYGVKNVACSGQSLWVDIHQTNDPAIGTCDMAGWFVTVTLPREQYGSCTDFDARLV